MTEWQWNVVLALCRIVLKMLQYGTANAHPSEEDMDLIRDAVLRERT